MNIEQRSGGEIMNSDMQQNEEKNSHKLTNYH
jgi:hypothetical protein